MRTLGIAALNRGDLLRRCVESVDHPIETLFLINNGRDASVLTFLDQVKIRNFKSEKFFRKIVIEGWPSNLGCGPSWNRIIKKSPGSWMITGNDAQFKPGAVAAIAEAEKKHPDAAMVCADGYSVFCMTELGRKALGLLDENFYPAYFEDVDHWRRLVLSGAKAVNAPGFEYDHGEAPHWGSATVKSDPALEKRVAACYQNGARYYREKWGGDPSKETFRTPFNRNVPLDFWELDPVLRRKNTLACASE